MTEQATVFVVDDDEAARESLRWLLESVGHRVRCHASAREFLAAWDRAAPGCLVLDVRMPGMSGMELQEHLKTEEGCLPVIIVTGHGDIPMAVRAMRGGAVDFLQKPYNDQIMLDRIQQALEQDGDTAQSEARRAVAELLEYTRTHFASEEALMEAAAYPALPAHRELHRELLLQVGEMELRVEVGEPSASLDLSRFLAKWLINHIQVADQRFGAFVAERS